MVSINDITVKINKKKILTGVNLDIKKGDFTYLIGPSGAGKTTLLKTIYMDVLPDEGFVSVDDYSTLKFKRRDLPHLRRKLGIIFQDFKLLEDRSIIDNIVFALKAVGENTKEAKKKSVRALTKVGLFEKRDTKPDKLSGGELQRACIARALANDPIMLIADEPTGNLDPATAREIFKVLKKINRLGTAVLIATHNYRIIKEFPGRVVRIRNGKIIKKKPVEEKN